MWASTAVLCPGQGAQSVGMGRAWFDASPEARAVFAEADRVLGSRLGAPLSELCLQGPADRLNRTDVSQPAIFVVSMASWRGVTARAGRGEGEGVPAAAAGLSLGEYTALCVAGSVSFADALELVTLRGRAMQDAAEATPGGMVALIGADAAQAKAVCDEARAGDVLVCANFNAPGQVVLSGSAGACGRAVAAASSRGLRATPLPVAGAFHSALMAPAAERLEAALRRTSLREPRCPVLSNVTARPHAPEPGATGTTPIADTIRRRLVEQLTSPVQWEGCCRWLIERMSADSGTAPGSGGSWEGFAELAPGKTLAGLMRRIDRGVKVTSHDEPNQGQG